MFEPKSKIIDGTKFTVVPFPAGQAFALQARLLKVLGPAFGQLIGALKGKSDTGLEGIQVDGPGIANALQTLFSQMDEHSFMDLVKTMLTCVSCEIDGGKGKVLMDFSKEYEAHLDMVFQGRLLTIYKVMGFVLEVNYPDFFWKVESIISSIRTPLSQGAGKSDEKPSTELESPESFVRKLKRNG